MRRRRRVGRRRVIDQKLRDGRADNGEGERLDRELEPRVDAGVGREGRDGRPDQDPTLQKPCRLDMTDRPNSFSTSTPSAFIAMSASPATAPETSRTAQSAASDVGSARRGRTHTTRRP